MPVGVIIVGAGRGERLGGHVPKQFLDLGGRSILRRSIEAFDRCDDVAAIVVVLPADLVGEAADRIGATRRPVSPVAGGSRRQDSVRLGLAALDRACDVVLVHDAARPLVDAALIGRVIEAVGRGAVVVPAVRARDTVKQVPPGQARVVRTIARDEIWLAQTPQGFPRAIIDELMSLATGADVTDEATLAEQAGYEVRVVDGDERNVKITTLEDLATVRRRIGPPARVGTGYDLHRLVPGRPLVLAGVTLPAERGPLGHSDGDVVCHALCDALFGGAGAGDIGRHFPNTDPRWQDAAGLDLLGRSVDLIGEAGWRVASVDVTIVLEHPKVAPHVPAIRDRLAGVLRLEAGAVSVKGKTNEGVDAVGRGEAIAAHAVAVLVPGVDG